MNNKPESNKRLPEIIDVYEKTLLNQNELISRIREKVNIINNFNAHRVNQSNDESMKKESINSGLDKLNSLNINLHNQTTELQDIFDNINQIV